MRAYIIAAAVLYLAVLLVGCGGGVEQARPPRQVPGISGTSGIEEPSARAMAEEFDYHGWQALRLSNELVTVVVVPEIGGRILEYKLGARPLLWVNPNELGKKYDPAAADAGTFRDFGGYRALPAPLEEWQGSPGREGSQLDSGRWTHQIITARGRKVEVELKSPADVEFTGLQITRTIALYAGGTEVHVTDKFENVGDRQVEWAIQHTSQLLGSLQADAEFSPESKLYFPLNPNSNHKRRFVYLTEGGLDQFNPIEDNSLMEVSYRRQAGRIGADSVAGWVAYLDALNNYAFAQRFTPSPLQDYPEQNSTVTVRTASDYAYMELGILTPVHTLAPGQSVESTLQWSATRLEGPVRDVSDVAAIHEPVKVTKADEQFKLTGKLGVFAPGELVILVKDKDGKPLTEPLKLAASVSEMTVVDKTLPAKADAASVVVELVNRAGSPLGEVASINVAPSLARADERNTTPERPAASQEVGPAGDQPSQ